MPYITVRTDVEMYLEDIFVEISDEDLLDEIDKRRLKENSLDSDVVRMHLDKIWRNRRLGLDYDSLVDELIYFGLGKIL